MNIRQKKDEQRIPLSLLLGSDKIRFYGFDRIQPNVQSTVDESFSKEILLTVPTLDISNYLSEKTKDLLEQSGSVAVSFNNNTVDRIHVLIAVLENESVKRILKRQNVHVAGVQSFLNSIAQKSPNDGISFQNSQILISQNLKLLLQDTLNNTKHYSNQIEPIHIFLELLKQDSSEVAMVINDAKIKEYKLIKDIKDEINRRS